MEDLPIGSEIILKVVETEKEECNGVHPNRETYYLFIDNWTQDVVRIHVSELLNGDYYIGKYDSVFVNEKMIEFYKRMIQCHEKRIKESLKKNSYGNL